MVSLTSGEFCLPAGPGHAILAVTAAANESYIAQMSATYPSEVPDIDVPQLLAAAVDEPAGLDLPARSRPTLCPPVESEQVAEKGTVGRLLAKATADSTDAQRTQHAYRRRVLVVDSVVV